MRLTKKEQALQDKHDRKKQLLQELSRKSLPFVYTKKDRGLAEAERFMHEPRKKKI